MRFIYRITTDDCKRQLHRMTQANLKRTHGDLCYPFRIEWPKDAAPSLYIEQPPGATGEPCGIRHYLEVFCLFKGDKPHKRYCSFPPIFNTPH